MRKLQEEDYEDWGEDYEKRIRLCYDNHLGEDEAMIMR